MKLFLCCADNLISGNAFKLGDIITYRNGKKVEVMNTDAEGRLVLADGLIDASAQKPEMIIDAGDLHRGGENCRRWVMIITRCSVLTMRLPVVCWRVPHKRTNHSGVCRWRNSTAASCRLTLPN
ncbi:hypothetical protein ACLB1S_22730 [Escherichia coli]